MTSTWIVGVDGSDNGRRAAEWAVDQAAGRDVRIVVLAAWTAPMATTGMLPGGMVLSNWTEVETAVERTTEALAAELARDGVEVEARTEQGAAAQVLIEASREADLLVVGGRGLGRAKGLMLGSVSQRCASHAVVPTAVIGDEAPLGRARKVIVGYDASANARRAASWALDFAGPDAEVTILDALALAPWLPADVVRERHAAEVDAVEAEFQAHMAELDPNRRATHTLVLADARVALLEASQQADLLVLGARGRGRLGAMLLGSTTNWLLQAATCAMVVVPPPDATT
jgi:nucleotide-binding universal stress UspA family protein